MDQETLWIIMLTAGIIVIAILHYRMDRQYAVEIRRLRRQRQHALDAQVAAEQLALNLSTENGVLRRTVACLGHKPPFPGIQPTRPWPRSDGK